MKKVFYSLMLGLAIVACEPAEYDDSALVERMDELEGKVDKIAEDLATLQGNVDALKTLSQALKDGKYITSVVQDEATGNYTITFSNGDTILIEKGEQGIQGEQGNSVTVVEKDGELYWQIEGSEDTYPVYKADPVFSSEDGKLYVQFEGEDKYEVGTLTGKSSFFENVKYDEAAGTVTFTLAEQFGGQSFTLAVTAFSLNISTTVGVTAGAVVDITYTVLGANDKTVVDVFSSGAYVAEVVAEDAANGVVKVTVPDPITAGNVLVWADNGEGKTSIRKISFEKERYEVTPIAASIPVAGGTIEVKGFSNVAFEVESDEEWLTVVSVKSGDFTITLNAEENTGDARTATVSLLRKGTAKVLTSFEVSQEGKAAEVALASLVWSTAVPFGGGADRNMTMDSEWIYVSKSSATEAAIKAIKITDNSVTKDVNCEGIAGGTHLTSCVGMLPNTDPNVNGGNPILIASNLTGSPLKIYVWTNGVDQKPSVVSLEAGSRRLGDKFTVRGSYQKGELWFWDFTRADDALCFVSINNGAFGNSGQYLSGRYTIPMTGVDSSTGAVYAHPDVKINKGVNDVDVVDQLFVSTNISDGFFTHANNNTSNYVLSEWTTDKDPKLDHAWGFNFFEHNGKDYIAYIQLINDRKNATLNIIEDTYGAEDFKGTLEAKTNIISINLLEKDGTEQAVNGHGACAYTETADGTKYIAAMLNNHVLSLYKLN